MNKVFCYEINEVPWRVIDFYLERRSNSALGKLLAGSHQFTSHTVDVGELQPWSTWPTMHRGVSNDTHQINFLNQDLQPAGSWPSIWEILIENNVRVGIFGSLQSYPPVRHENVAFHIPDTFAAGPETVPAKYQPFQAFNLKQTGENSAVTSEIGASDAKSALSLLKTGIKATTFAKVAAHLAKEKANALHKKRRTLLQPELAFDVLLDCLKKDQPQYVTFFSNHVAGIMHRYWKYSFPEDFNYTLNNSAEDKFHAESIMVAMDILDKQLAVLITFCENNGYDLMLCSSMGQEAIERGDYVPELRMKDFEMFKKRVSAGFDFSMNLAMQPDVAFEFNTPEHLQQFKAILPKLTDGNGAPVMPQGFDEVGCTLNLKLARSEDVAATGCLLFHGERVAVEEFGLELISRDIGTGYHQPEGIWTWQDARGNLQQDRDKVDTRQFPPTILKHFGIEPKEYMQQAVAI